MQGNVLSQLSFAPTLLRVRLQDLCTCPGVPVRVGVTDRVDDEVTGEAPPARPEGHGELQAHNPGTPASVYVRRTQDPEVSCWLVRLFALRHSPCDAVFAGPRQKVTSPPAWPAHNKALDERYLLGSLFTTTATG